MKPTRSRAHDAGMTLVELLVTMMLLGMVGTLVTAAVVNAARALTHTDDENSGLQDAKVILERMGRDARQARGVVCDASASDPDCESHLQLWVDSNSDYVQQDSEVVTWELEQDPDGEHFDVYRIQGLGAGATKHRQASALIVDTLFLYDPGKPIEQSQTVKIVMHYDAILGRGTKEREASFTARLRNKGSK